MQAIQTKFLSPTNTRDPRIKAWCDAGSVKINWDDSAEIETNHANAANMLTKKLCWAGKLVGGSLPSGGYAFVFARGD